MTEFVGPYEVVQLLAAGGMAEIFLAKKTGPGGFEKKLVIKRITRKLLGDREIHAMFLDEARVQAMLDHPNVVQIYDFGEDKGSFFIAMEFVAGATLRWVIDNARAVSRPVPVPHALRIASDVLGALHSAHQLVDDDGQNLGLIHRDISPVNVLVARSGAAKLCDFGVAKSMIQTQHTRVGIVKGKFRYMSPEQLNGEPIDARADVFAVGVVLWETLVGRRLFDDPAEEGVVAAIRSGHYPSPSEFRAGLPKAIDRILSKALAPTREERFKNARAFAMACEEVLRLLPKSSTTLQLGEYVSAELDGTAGLQRDRTRVMPVDAMSSGFEALDPPVPGGPTQIADASDLEEHTDRVEEPSALGRAASVALMVPAGAFAGVAKAVSAVGGLVERRRDPTAVKVTRTTSRD